VRRFALFQKAGLVDDEYRIVVGQRLQRIVAQRMRIPTSAAQNGLLTPWPRIAGCFRSHPACLAPRFAEQTVEEILRRSRHAVLREQRMHPTLRITQRRRPQLQRSLDRSSRYPMFHEPNHGTPVYQKSFQYATVMVRSFMAGRSGFEMARVGFDARTLR
jgi:hypothetical protein